MESLIFENLKQRIIFKVLKMSNEVRKWFPFDIFNKNDNIMFKKTKDN